MYGDFSRMTYSRAKNYTGVWSQQGRVQLDSDANEQTAIVLEWLRTLAIDFVGPFGGHVDRAGFAVAAVDDDLTFSEGHYYVYGLRCEVPEPDGTPTTYLGLLPDADPLPEPPYVVALLVWERSVSAVVDTELLEPALGPFPPDTTIRSQVAWVPTVSKALPLPLPDGTPITSTTAIDLDAVTTQFRDYNRARAKDRPLLMARVDRDVTDEEASIVPATSGYLGVENQLYRVEVHRGGTVGGSGGGPTFKWSGNNGLPVFGIVAFGTETKPGGSVRTVTLEGFGRDKRTGLDVGDWVELIDDTTRPFGPVRPLLAVQSIDREARTVTLSAGITTDLSRHPYLRRWDQPADAPSGPDGIPIIQSTDGDTWLEIEDGVQIAFPVTHHEYLPGDYWLIPARAATGGLLWPGGTDPAALPPHGPTRYLAPLALVTDAKGNIEDLRSLFTHLAWPLIPSTSDPKAG